MRKQQSARMHPYVPVGKTYNSRLFGIEAKNSGRVLARIKTYIIHTDQDCYKGWLDFLNSLAPDLRGIDYGLIGTSGNIRDQMISPREIKTSFFCNRQKKQGNWKGYFTISKLRAALLFYWEITG